MLIGENSLNISFYVVCYNDMSGTSVQSGSEINTMVNGIVLISMVSFDLGRDSISRNDISIA
jgi:hypothetical protein